MKNTSATQVAPKRLSVIELSGVKAQQLRNILVLLAICLVLLFWRLGDLPFFTRGEPREGLVVWEMHSSGNWILPVVNGEYIPFKPPLFHWLALLAGFIFGRIDEFTLRLPSALLAAAGGLMIYRATARLWGERAGLIAGIVLLTNAEWWQAGTDTQVDMTLAFFISAACLYFYFLYQQRNFSLVKSLGLPFLLGLATLAKGPLGLAMPGMVFFTFLGLRRDFSFVKKLHPLASAVVFLLTAGSWYGAAIWQGGPAFFFRQIVDENFRTAAGTYGHFQPAYYYLPIFLENATPWSFFFPSLALFVYRRRGKLSEQHLLFPLIWFIVGLVFFSASLGKRGVYILPLYPPMALLFGAWWQQLEESMTRNRVARLSGFLLAFSSLFALLVLGFHVAVQYGLVHWNLVTRAAKFKTLSRILLTLSLSSPLLAACAATCAAALLCLIWALSKQNWRVAFAALTSMTIAVSLVTKNVIFPPIVYERTMKSFMTRVNEKIDPKIPLLFYRRFDYGAVFYAGRHVPRYRNKANEVDPPFYLLMWEEDWQRLKRRNDLTLSDVSEGRGPAGRHRLTLVEYQPSATSAPEPLPVAREKNQIDDNGDRDM